MQSMVFLRIYFLLTLLQENKRWTHTKARSPLLGGSDPLSEVINRALSTWGRYGHEVTIETRWSRLRRHLTLRTTVLYKFMF